MKNDLYTLLEKEYPEAIKGEVTMPGGTVIPVLGTIGDDGINSIHPTAMELIETTAASKF